MNREANVVILSDVVDVNPALPQCPANDDLVSFVPMSALDAETGTTSCVGYRKYGDAKSGYTAFIEGDVLVAKITPCFENGKIGQATLQSGVGLGSTEFHVIRPRADLADGRYVFHFLRQDRIRAAGQRRMTGSAGQRRVPADFLSRLRIPLPSLGEQKRIAKVLDVADLLRRKRRASMVTLANVSQALFVDAFGDPATNTRKLHTATLESVCTRITDGTHQPPAWSPEGHPFLFVRNIVGGEISFDTEKFISEETHAELTRRCPIEIGDVLYSTVGSYGIPALVSTSRKFAFQRHIAHLKPNRALLNSEFLRAMLASPGLRRQADRAARGVAQKTVNLSDIKKFTVFSPSLSEQEEFATRIERLEILKNSNRDSLAEIEALFASLQYGAFHGEL